jgi:mRNA interferase HicA
VKRTELIGELVRSGCYLKRHGSKPDIYANPRTGKQAPVPRHVEIKDSLCELIRRQLGITEQQRPNTRFERDAARGAAPLKRSVMCTEPHPPPVPLSAATASGVAE